MDTLTEAMVHVGGRDVPISTDQIGGATPVEPFLRGIETHDANARAAMAAVWSDSLGPRFYFEHFGEELGPEVVGRSKREFLERLQLVATWFSSAEQGDGAGDGVDWLAHLDYSIAPDEIDYLVTVSLRPDGTVVEIDVES